MIEIHKGKHLKDGTTSIDFTQDGKPLKLEKDKRTPHPDLINAFQALDIHAALIPPRLMQPEEHKRKKVKAETGSWFKPEFVLKETADSFHCTGFTITDKGAIILSGTVTSEHNGSMNYNCPQKSLVETELFGTYDFTDDLRECINHVKLECELYIGGKVHPDSVQTTGEDEDGATLKETPVTGIKGVGGKEDGFVDPGQRLKEVDETIAKGKDGETWEDIQKRTEGTRGAAAKRTGKGKQQTPDNPAGK